jgi:hypothetical protein
MSRRGIETTTRPVRLHNRITPLMNGLREDYSRGEGEIAETKCL